MDKRTKTVPKLDTVILEMGLKPFKQLDDEYIDSVCITLLQQWRPLLEQAERRLVQLWVAEGSEILEWKGNLDEPFEWDRYIGNNINGEYPNRADFAKNARLYKENPVEFTYRDLRRIVDALKRIAKTEYGYDLKVGTIFDIGPEFAVSKFKFKKHPELLKVELNGEIVSTVSTGFLTICCWSRLHADPEPYAGFPEGIPEGTPFGTFLGRQCQSFLTALGFDFLWLSNGFGFSSFPWSYRGVNFDGSSFGKADYEEVTGNILSFWESFKAECPDIPIYCRGTNMGVGVDVSTDFIPLKTLYDRGYFELSTPNSPWAALDFDFGLEWTGYMSRVSELTGKNFLFRFYPNDPWYWQNPWWDTMNREPFDIYWPLSIGRLNAAGQIENPSSVAILSVDTEFGDLVEDCPMEVIPHIRRAAAEFPDEPGLLTWLYPFTEYHETAKQDPANVGHLFFEDWYVRNAVNYGLPLNTVVSTSYWDSALQSDPSLAGKTIFLMPASLLETGIERWQRFAEAGGRLLIYGALPTEAAARWLGLELKEPLEGEFELNTLLKEDACDGSAKAARLEHPAFWSGGGLRECLSEQPDGASQVLAECVQDGAKRVYALTRAKPDWNGGRVTWVRGSLSFDRQKHRNKLPNYTPQFALSASLARFALQTFGCTLLQTHKGQLVKPAATSIARHDNAYIFTGYRPDVTVEQSIAFPQGAPIFTGKAAYVSGGLAHYTLDTTIRAECRIFVKQAASGVVSCKVEQPFPTLRKHTVRNLILSGLEQADVTVYPPFFAIREGRVEFLSSGRDVPAQLSEDGKSYLLTGVTGTVEISW